MSSRRSLRIEPSVAQEILQSQGQITKGTPAEHVTTPSSPAFSAESSRTSFQSHARTMSVATDATTSTAPRSNRFSMSFPVQPSGSASPVRTSQSPVREAGSTVEPAATSTGPVDTNFLTAIAAQERRVLELKEDLAKAEADLNRLKRQWAQHEAHKKRNDARSLTKLQPLQTSLPDADSAEDTDGSNAWMQQEMERRKALMSGNRASNRTVFSGSKHTRTLSLLSPTTRTPGPVQIHQRPELPARKDSLSGSVRQSQDDERAPRPMPLSRAATTPDLTVDGTRAIETISEGTDPSVDRDMLIEASKKVATGLRDGLWTFWEDLRQATVGEETTTIPPPRRQSSNQTLRTAKKQSSVASLRPGSRGSTTSKTSTDTKKPSPSRRKSLSTNMYLGSAPALADPSFWTEHGILPPNYTVTPGKKATQRTRHTKSPSKATSIESNDNEAWDTWDESSPQVSRSSSAASEPTTVPSTVSDVASPRTSADANFDAALERSSKPQSNRNSIAGSAKKDAIPWPALANLGPKALRRTASHLMSEWEKSLTPSPSKEYKDGDDYLGLGSEAAAVAVSGDRRMQ